MVAATDVFPGEGAIEFLRVLSSVFDRPCSFDYCSETLPGKIDPNINPSDGCVTDFEFLANFVILFTID